MNKKILIYGGTGAIGSAIAKKLKLENYEPILISRNEDELKKISNNIKCEYRVCDILETSQIAKIADEFKDGTFGIAYCIGSINLKPLRLSNDDEFIESFKINTLGAINAIKLSYESLKNNNGSILLFSTIAVKQGFVNHSIVSSSKGAIEGLNLSLAAEFSPNIRVNCIAPSLTDSKMSQKFIKNDTIRKAIEDMHPLPKLGVGDDFAEIATFLLSDKNKWVTGQIFHIDGGRSTLRLKA